MMFVSSEVKPRSQHSLSFLTGSRAEGPRGRGPRDTRQHPNSKAHSDASRRSPKEASGIGHEGKGKGQMRVVLDPESSIHPEGCPIPKIQRPKQA